MRRLPLPSNPALPDPELSDALAWLERLVGFDTTSRNSNLALIEAIEAHLAGLGIGFHRVPGPTAGKASLHFSIGPMVAGGVVLSAHTDVVPVDGQAWSADPFRLRVQDGCAYGRGTADMKGFVALVLAALPEMLAAPLSRPIHVALSHDEEIGLLGVPSLIAHMTQVLPAPAAVIVGEPTGMRVVDRHKGILGLRTTVTGHEAHSSQTHLGVSANMVAVRLMGWVDDTAERLAAAPADPADRMMPPHTTITIGLVEGGTAGNILAGQCRFVWDIRPAPGRDDPYALLRAFETEAASQRAAMRARFPDCTIETEILSDAPALSAEPGGAASQLAMRCALTNEAGAATYLTEAGLFQQAGLSTVVCGPGAIAQAHQPDEFIALDQLAAGRDFLRRLVAECCA